MYKDISLVFFYLILNIYVLNTTKKKYEDIGLAQNFWYGKQTMLFLDFPNYFIQSQLYEDKNRSAQS